MALLHNVTVPHCYVNETGTAAFPLPPQLEEWKIWTSEPIRNIPSRHKSLSCYGSQHVVIRSVAITLTSMTLSRLSISADFMFLNQSVIPEYTEINAIVLKCRAARNGKKSALLGTRNIKCRELDCAKIEHILEMVEKLTYNPAGDAMSKRRLATGVAKAIPKYKRLKSLLIKGSVETFVDGQKTLRMPCDKSNWKADRLWRL